MGFGEANQAVANKSVPERILGEALMVCREQAERGVCFTALELLDARCTDEPIQRARLVDPRQIGRMTMRDRHAFPAAM